MHTKAALTTLRAYTMRDNMMKIAAASFLVQLNDKERQMDHDNAKFIAAAKHHSHDLISGPQAAFYQVSTCT